MTENTPEQVRGVVDNVYSADSRRILATLIRLLGGFELAEEERTAALREILPQLSAFV